MCLAVPGRILETEQREGSRMGRVQFGGIVREVYLDFVPEAGVGDYVLVHVGFAISRVDPGEAARTLELFKALGAIDDTAAESAEAESREPAGSEPASSDPPPDGSAR